MDKEFQARIPRVHFENYAGLRIMPPCPHYDARVRLLRADLSASHIPTSAGKYEYMGMSLDHSAKHSHRHILIHYSHILIRHPLH